MLWLVLLFVPLLSAQVTKELFSQCSPNIEPIGQICVNVTSRDCFELTGKVTVNGVPVLGPRQLSIPQLVSMASQRPGSGPQTYCEAVDLNLPISVPACSICTTVDSLKIQGDDLSFCGKLSVNCSGLIPFKREFSVPCLNITDCRFGCSRGCSTGTCSATGVCVCPTGLYGPDCSVSLRGNCLVAKNGQQACWSYNVPDCKTIQVQRPCCGILDSTIGDNATLELLPCTNGLSLNVDNRCKMCVFADQIHVDGTSLIGRPIVRQVCGGFTVYSSNGQQTTLTQSSILSCSPGDNNNNDTSSTWSSARIILVSLMVVLAVGVIIIGAYFGYQKYQGWKDTQDFMRVPTSTDDMANVALKDESQEDDSV